MARAFQFDVETVVKQLNRILQMELAAVIYYTHYSFMIYGHARIPITSWLAPATCRWSSPAAGVVAAPKPVVLRAEPA